MSTRETAPVTAENFELRAIGAVRRACSAQRSEGFADGVRYAALRLERAILSGEELPDVIAMLLEVKAKP